MLAAQIAGMAGCTVLATGPVATLARLAVKPEPW